MSKPKDKESGKTNIIRRYRVYVVGGGYEYIRMLFNLGYDGAKGLEDADVVLFTGGEDVNPELYGEVCMAKTNFSRCTCNPPCVGHSCCNPRGRAKDDRFCSFKSPFA